jgi:hypothetical protein
MADDQEYDEVEAVVRIPKGERLADSRKTAGWSRGFTPKSTDRGPEHVEIRLKDEDDSESVQEPEVIYVTEYVDAPQQREPSVAEQAVADFLRGIADELIEAAKPHVVHWWNTQVIPALRGSDDLLLQRQARKARKALRGKTAAAPLVAEQAVQDGASSQQVGTSPHDPKIAMTSEQFQQLFMTWLAQEDAQQALWDAIANAHIRDGDATTLAWRQGLNELSAQQRTERVREILSANPSILEDLGRHLMGRRPLELGEAVRRRDEQ